MNTVTLIVSVSLLCFAIALLGGLGYFVYKPVRELLIRSKSNSALSQKLVLIELADSYIQDDQPIQALSVLSKIPYLDVPRSAEMISGIRELNQGFLARSLVLSEKLGARISNLELLESLIIERSELIQLLFKARFSFETLLGKREDDGKTLPKWTKDEFKKKESEINDALKVNLAALEKEISTLVSALRQGSSGEYLIH